ncbi:MAG: hypothetical protein V3S29_00365, partial [bacterium]
MRDRKSLILLIGIMTVIVLFVTGTTLVLLYRVGLEDNRNRLLATVKSIARVLEEVETTRGQFAPIFVYPEHLRATLLL